MSLKLVPFESLGAVSYSPSIVTMAVSVAVCEIVCVKDWCDLENMVRVRSRSSERIRGAFCDDSLYKLTFTFTLEMAPFNRSHTSSYSPSMVTMAISCIVCEI